jgi:hypothetical protein
MKLNQFETSIRFIHDTVPGFIRKMYEDFLVFENELYAQLKKANETVPYSVNNYILQIIHQRRPYFIQIMKYIMSEENQIKLQLLLFENCKLNKCESSFINNEEMDWMPEGDIVAPVTSLEGFISAFSSDCERDLPLICIEPVVINKLPFVTVAAHTKYSNARIWDFDIYNEIGNISLFDSMHSVVKIDINHVFTYFFYSLLSHYVLPNTSLRSGDIYEVPVWELYSKFHDCLWNGELDEYKDIMLRKYIQKIVGSAILTYMTYAGRLIGAKENMLNWLYTTFVKDAVDSIKSGEFQTVSDVTEYIDPCSVPHSEVLDDYNKKKLFKALRLNYSNWATVINAITQMTNREKDKKQIPTYCYREFRSKNRDTDAHITMAYTILSEYISHNYATYNVYIFPSPDKGGLTLASYFIKFVSSRIFNTEIKDIIRFSCINVFDVRCKCIRSSCPHSREITDYYINSEDAISMVHALKFVKSFLADLFMNYAYILMLNGLYNNQDTILDDIDPFTGVSKKELFLNIYKQLVNNINRCFEGKAGEWRYKEIVIYSGGPIKFEEWYCGQFAELNKDIKEIYTPLEVFFNNTEVLGISDDVNTIRGVLRNIISPITINEMNYESLHLPYYNYKKLITELYDIHPLSVLIELYEKYTENKSLVITSDVIIDKETYSHSTKNSKFPRNRITNEMITKTKLYEPRLFASLESAGEILSKANEDATLGNNANYSFIGGIGGSVTEEEDNDIRLQNEQLLHDNTIQFNGLESLQKLDINTRSIQVNNLIESFNELFKKIILDGNDLECITQGNA